MSLIRRNRREIPELNTASLPDLIFVVLFFFMIVTHMRTETMRVKCDMPQGSSLSQAGKKSATVYIYIGRQTDDDGTATGEPTNIQMNGRIISIDEVTGSLLKEKAEMSPEDKQKIVVSIKADKKAPMGIVTAVKQAIRQARIYNVCYSAREI